MVCLMPPGKSVDEVVKARVEKSVGTRSCEVITKDGARYCQKRHHLRKPNESYSSKSKLICEEGADQSGAVQPAQSPPGQVQTSHELTAPCSQSDAPSDPLRPPGQPELQLSQPTALPMEGTTTRSGIVVRRPSYLKDYVTANL